MNGRISNFSQVASIRRYTITEGRGKGLDVIDCDNGKMRFLLNVDRALDIMQLYYCGQNMSFVSKNGFSRKDGDFSERFEGGMLYTCGLDSIGRREVGVIHGKIHLTPAEVVRAECTEEGIVVEANIVVSALFGECLCVRRKISSAIGSDTLTLEDTLTNCGDTEQNYALLYHVNIGYPMLDAGAKILADVECIKGSNAWSDENIAAAFELSEPVDGINENCYFINLKKPAVTLVNENIKKAFTLSYSGDTLPCFTEWKSMRSHDYAVGFEPCTCELGKGFEYKKIAVGESIDFSLAMTVKSI